MKDRFHPVLRGLAVFGVLLGLSLLVAPPTMAPPSTRSAIMRLEAASGRQTVARLVVDVAAFAVAHALSAIADRGPAAGTVVDRGRRLQAMRPLTPFYSFASMPAGRATES